MITIPAAETCDILIPRTIATPDLEGCQLVLVGNISRESYTCPMKSVAVDGDYYAIRADFSPLPTSGEYDYLLTFKGAVFACGVAKMEAQDEAPDQYVKQETFEQYGE